MRRSHRVKYNVPACSCCEACSGHVREVTRKTASEDDRGAGLLAIATRGQIIVAKVRRSTENELCQVKTVLNVPCVIY